MAPNGLPDVGSTSALQKRSQTSLFPMSSSATDPSTAAQDHVGARYAEVRLSWAYDRGCTSSCSSASGLHICGSSSHGYALHRRSWKTCRLHTPAKYSSPVRLAIHDAKPAIAGNLSLPSAACLPCASLTQSSWPSCPPAQPMSTVCKFSCKSCRP